MGCSAQGKRKERVVLSKSDERHKVRKKWHTGVYRVIRVATELKL